MAKVTRSLDKFSNKLYASVTMSAANTLTFAEIETGIEAFSKQAWIIHKLDYFFSNAIGNLLLASDDYIEIALTSNNQMTALNLNNAGVVDKFQVNGTHTTYESPFTRDFTTLPGGGLIIAPRPLYLAMNSASIASAGSAQVRGYFTVIPEMSPDEYLDLVDYYRIIQ